MFNLTANDLFDRDDLLQGTPEGAYRVARSIIALIMRVGEGASAAERAAGKVLHGKAHCKQFDSLKQPVWDMIKGCVIVYTQPLDTAALRVADTQGGESL